jgi:hypothetical protein
MAQDNLQALFGGTMLPEEMQQQLLNQRAREFATLTPSQQLSVMGYKAGAGLGQGLAQAMGVDITDPAIKRMSTLRSLAQGIENTSEGMMQYAQKLRNAGFATEAAQAMDKAREIELTKAKTTSLVEDKQAAREQQQEQFVARLAQQRDLAEQANQTKLMIAQMTKSLAGANSDLQRQILQGKIDTLNEKKTAIEEARQTKLQNSVDVADNALQLVKDAKALTTGLTTGLTGALGGVIPGTSPYVLQSKIDTIKAQLGFGQLQAMRDASPTGGALGQVSNQEIKYLQSAIANLDRGLPPAELKKNLDNIEKHYTKWREAAMGKLESKAQPSPVSNSGTNNDPLGIRK